MPAIEKRMFSAVSTIAAIAAGVAARKAVRALWTKKFHEEPPQNPASRDTAWQEALLWSVATGAVIGVTRMLARRGTAAGWERVTGHRAPA